MSHEIDMSNGEEYSAGIKSLRSSLSKDGKTISGSKAHDETVIVILNIYGKPALNVLLLKANLYLLGFKDPAAVTWLVFQGYTKIATENTGKMEDVITKKSSSRQTSSATYKVGNCKELGVGCNYNDLGVFDKGYKATAKDIMSAVQTLADYKIGKSIDTVAVATLIFTISESLRFSKITEAVTKALETYEDVLDFDSFKAKVTNWDKNPDADAVIKLA